MIDDRFKIENFNKLEHGSDEALKLLKELELEVSDEIHSVVSAKFTEITKALIKLGHSVTQDIPEFDSEFSSWAYESRNTEQEKTPRVWVSTQVGAMSGYSATDE